MLITLRNTGTSFNCEYGETILSAALRQGVQLARACESGGCGMCRGQVLSGSVSHSDVARALTASDVALDRALFCCAFAESDLLIDASLQERPNQAPVEFPARVTAIEQLTADVRRLTLRFPPGMSPDFTPGQFLHVAWTDGQRRAFSIANKPREDETVELHVGLKPGGSFTRHVFETMKTGDVLRLSGPHGTFRYRPSEKPTVFVAGGTGIAPIFAMLDVISSEPPAKPVSLYWGCRSSDGFYLANELRELSERFPRLDVHLVVSDPEPHWFGRSGFVHEACFADIQCFNGCELYACGNPFLIDALEKGALDRGLAPDRFFADKFN